MESFKPSSYSNPRLFTFRFFPPPRLLPPSLLVQNQIEVNHGEQLGHFMLSGIKPATMTEYISLKPNRDLLNAKFESYHLGSAILQIERKSFLQPVAYYPLTDEHYSFSHLSAHAVQNLLVLDLWNKESNVVYFVDESCAVMGLPYDKVVCC